MATRFAVRPRRLASSEAPLIARLLDDDRVANAYLRSELRSGASGTWWGIDGSEGLRAVALVASLTVPCIPHRRDGAALAEALDAVAPPRILVGPRDATIALHEAFSRPACDLRDHQPLLALRRSAPLPEVTVPVRRGTPADLDILVMAAAAMHQEEMGVDPLSVDPAWWRSRMAHLIQRGWSWVWTDHGDVVFKAELSALTDDVVQLQGVYTAPAHRHRGVATAGMAAICRELRAEVDTCSLYANAGNHGALRLYRRLGFEQVGEYATVIY